MSIPLLKTKLYMPPIQPGLVPRPRLVEQLNAGMARKLTLVSAPAGFGKTTLVSAWAATLTPSVAWLSLDPGDNDFYRFLEYLVTALQSINAGIGDDVLSVLQSPQLPPLEALLTLLINDLAALPVAALPLTGVEHDRPHVLVLDDYHVIDAAPIHQALTFLLDHLPPQLHLVILTREDPPLPLPRLRVRRQITHIRAQDLRFTVDEATHFFHETAGVPLTPDDVAALEHRTEGWIAGLQMAALTMQHIEDVAAFIRAFTGDDRYVVDYLMTEVLARQPEHIQTFLLQTSVLRRFNAELCDAVRFEAVPVSFGTHDGREILAYLERANLFVLPLDNRREWFRYHNLFGDLLRYQLRAQEGDVRVHALHGRAALWYAQRDLVDDALYHYLSAQDMPAAVSLVAGHAMPAFRRGDIHRVRQWLQALPEAMLRGDLRLCCAVAWICAVRDDFPRLAEFVTAAEALLPGSAYENDAAFLGEWAALRAYAAFLLGDAQTALALGQQALEQSPADFVFVHGAINVLLADIYTHTGIGHVSQAVTCSQAALTVGLSSASTMYIFYAADRLTRALMLQGRFAAAEAAFQQVFDLVRERGLVYAPILEILDMKYAQVRYEVNAPAEAETWIRDGLALSQQFGLPHSALWGRLLLRQAQAAQGVTLDALDPLATDIAIDALFRELASQASPHPVLPQFAALRAQLWAGEGQLPRAERWAEDVPLSLRDEPAQGQISDYLALVHVHLALDKALPDVLTLLDKLEQLTSHKGCIQQVVQISLLRVLVLDRLDQPQVAQVVLEKALALAEPTGMIRTFLDHGDPLMRLVRQAKHTYAVQLIAALAPNPAAVPDGVPAAGPHEALSEREIEVLRFFAAGLTNAAIAQRLFVSQNTVKWYAKNIYRKLDVHNRSEALAKAFALNLLSHWDKSHTPES